MRELQAERRRSTWLLNERDSVTQVSSLFLDHSHLTVASSAVYALRAITKRSLTRLLSKQVYERINESTMTKCLWI